MHKLIYFFCSLLLIIPYSHGIKGACPGKVEHHGSVIINALINKVFHQVESTSTAYSKCISWTFLADNDMNLSMEMKYKSWWFGIQKDETYLVSFINPFTFQTTTPHWYGNSVSNSYYIRDTDNKNYIVLSTCNPHLFNAYHTEQSWILTLNTTDSFLNTVNDKINNGLKKVGMDRKDFSKEKEC